MILPYPLEEFTRKEHFTQTNSRKNYTTMRFGVAPLRFLGSAKDWGRGDVTGGGQDGE